jgi:hypothetical protein
VNSWVWINGSEDMGCKCRDSGCMAVTMSGTVVCEAESRHLVDLEYLELMDCSQRWDHVGLLHFVGGFTPRIRRLGRSCIDHGDPKKYGRN